MRGRSEALRNIFRCTVCLCKKKKKKKICSWKCRNIPAYIHLPRGHEVCTLAHPLKDLLKLGVDEGIVWGGEKIQSLFETVKYLNIPLHKRRKGHYAVITGVWHLPCMLSICPILSAAPRTLHSVLTILSALASDRRGESNKAFMSTRRVTCECMQKRGQGKIKHPGLEDSSRLHWSWESRAWGRFDTSLYIQAVIWLGKKYIYFSGRNGSVMWFNGVWEQYGEFQYDNSIWHSWFQCYLHTNVPVHHTNFNITQQRPREI